MGPIPTPAKRPAVTDATPPALSTNKPLAVFRLNAISAAVFLDREATGNVPARYHIALARRYRDDEGTWHSASSLRPDDLLAAAEALTRCWEYLREGWGDRAPAA